MKVRPDGTFQGIDIATPNANQQLDGGHLFPLHILWTQTTPPKQVSLNKEHQWGSTKVMVGQQC